MIGQEPRPGAAVHRSTVNLSRDGNAVAVLAAIAGLLSCISQLPSALSGVLLALFIFLGPGNLLVALLPDLSPLSRRTLVPVLGLSVVIIVAAVSVVVGFYAPRPMLAVLAAVVLIAGLAATWRATEATTGAGSV